MIDPEFDPIRERHERHRHPLPAPASRPGLRPRHVHPGTSRRAPDPSIQIHFHSIDDADRTISCTAVTGVEGLWPMVYSTKATQSTANGTCSHLAWGPGDFGGSSEIPYGFHVSVTCSLPPQTSITSILNSVQYEIGN